MKYYLLTAIASIFVAGCSSHQSLPLATAPSIELDRYTGTWYEIARYENRFEIGCVGATANYTVEDDHIAVTNSCYDQTGKMSAQAHGKAYTVENSQNTKLRVSFFWPFYGDYWVIKLSDNYRYSVVGEPTRKYLWILSRTPVLNDADRSEILSELPKFGYDANKLYWTSYGALAKE